MSKVGVLILSAALALALATAGTALAATPLPAGYSVATQQTVYPGVEYQRIAKPSGPVLAHVAHIVAGAPVDLRIVSSHDKVPNKTADLETTSAMCKRTHCVVAVNGDFHVLGQPVGGPRQNHDLDGRRGVGQLPFEALVPGDGEGPQHHVEGVAHRRVGDTAGDVQDEDPVNRPGQGVRQGHVVDHAAVDQRPMVVQHRREASGQGGAGQQGRLERAGGQHDLLPGGQVAGDDPDRDDQLRELLGRRHLVDQGGQPGVGVEVVAARQEAPGPAEAAAGEDVLRAQRRPHGGQVVHPPEAGVGGDAGAVEGPGRGADDDVGEDAPLQEGPQHAHLGAAVVAPAGEHERRLEGHLGPPLPSFEDQRHRCHPALAIEPLVTLGYRTSP